MPAWSLLPKPNINSSRPAKPPLTSPLSVKAFAPKQDITEIRAEALDMETVRPGAGVKYIQNLPPLEDKGLSRRITASMQDGDVQDHRIDMGEVGLRETVKGYLQATEPNQKMLRNGGIIRATNNKAKAIEEAVLDSRKTSMIAAKLAKMVKQVLISA